MPSHDPARPRRPVPAAPAVVIDEPDYQISHLANGLTVCTFPMPWLHEAGATLLARAGSRFEAEEEGGAAHLLEHMLFKGTERFPDPTAFHTRLEALAADMNAATGQEHNAYWITLPPEFLEEGFSLFCEMFTRPALTGLETERGVVIAEMREDENEAGQITAPALLAGELLWPGHPLARSILGSRESVAGLDAVHLRRFLTERYCGLNMAVAFFGPLNHQQTVAMSEQALGGLPRGVLSHAGPPAPMPPGPHWRAVDDQTAQLGITLSFRTDGLESPRRYPLAALRRLLDDGFAARLQATVREKRGLVYDLWASYVAYSDTGAFELGASVSPENLAEVFEALLAQLEELGAAPPAPEEWTRILTRWRVGLTTALDRPSELMERYVADRLFGHMEPLSEVWRQVRAIRPEMLPELARMVFRPENLVVVLVGPRAQEILPILQSRFPLASAPGVGGGALAP